jgi:hypothetical protein
MAYCGDRHTRDGKWDFVAKDTKQAPRQEATDVDRYPKLDKVFRQVLKRLDDPDAPVERVEVTCLASGEATYRVWSARAIEPDGGYIGPDEDG